MRPRFTHLLPILIVVMILYEFSTQGFTIDASVNKLLVGAIYGLLIFIGAYIVKAIAQSIYDKLGKKSESDSQIVQEPR